MITFRAMASKGWFSFWESKVLALLLVVSLGLNVAYYLRLRDQSELIHRLQDHLSPPALQVGQQVPDLKALTLDEQVMEIGFPEPRLLFVFSKDCKVCQANFPNWGDLEREIGEGNVLYIATNPLAEAKRYAAQRRIEDRTVLFADARQGREDYRISRVPQTILVAGNEVKAIEVGILDREKKRRLLSTWSKHAGGEASGGSTR